METIKEFCDSVGKEYTYYLYQYFNIQNKGKLNRFPWCCHASSNLIASYLSVHYDKSIVHKKTPAHGVALGEDCVVDFTEFQFRLTKEEKERFYDSSNPYKKEEIYALLNREPVYQNSDSASFIVANSFGNCPLFGVKYAKKIEDPKTLNGFMQYVKLAIKDVGEKVVNAGLY
ncbi:MULTISPECIES: hypothetical protein [Cytobacillus]|uniref:Uncharacterized protein n=2 Tax=Bacillati TaxID=1783272 RepID=A0A2N0Z996_9BACI|nr:hypothetical protein [Cytobacillus horneckiae]MEC1157777.1 hypothetical protein [Cytobacillus horneckiae]PKG26067.1 hypothetical protein CWS20_25845 [Cytobacillus horneckiae]